uniref:Uncharacterized protein n=1 Tax=Oryza nivara TaxID=4536 RepID=A0A0E0HPA1_ORYNI
MWALMVVSCFLIFVWCLHLHLTSLVRRWFVMEDDELSANITDGSQTNGPFEIIVTCDGFYTWPVIEAGHH